MREQQQQANGPINNSASGASGEGGQPLQPPPPPSTMGSVPLNQVNDDDVWSQEDDEITAQYMQMHKMRNNCERDAISQMSLDSCDSRDPGKFPPFSCIHLNNLT